MCYDLNLVTTLVIYKPRIANLEWILGIWNNERHVESELYRRQSYSSMRSSQSYPLLETVIHPIDMVTFPDTLR